MSHTGASLPPHPGPLLRTTLDHLNCTKSAAARLLGLSRQTLYQIIGENQAITPVVALRVAKLTGTTAEYWVNLQQTHDLAVARAQYRNLVGKVPQLEERW